MAMNKPIKFFAGNSNNQLVEELQQQPDFVLGEAEVKSFKDGEIGVNIDESVRGQDVFIVQSTSNPANDNLMELLTMVDALRRSAANKITAVIPYFGYARQDRRPHSTRVPITSKLVANMLQSAGVDHVITMDLHAEQIQGFFDIPLDNVSAIPAFVDDIQQRWGDQMEKVTIVSPDIGGVARARVVAKALGVDLAIVDKRRRKANEAEVMNVIGEIEGRTCIVVDDIVDTAGTLCRGADALIDQGAENVVAYTTHPVLSGNAIDNLNDTKLRKLVATNTIELSDQVPGNRVRQVSIAERLAKAIRLIDQGGSLTENSLH